MGCSKKNDTSIGNTIFNLRSDQDSVLADGAKLVNLTCELNPDATVDRRNILFKTTGGQFLESKDTTVEVKAQFVDQKLIAKAIFQVSQSPGVVIISAQPNLPDQKNNNYVLKDTIFLVPSIPASLKLSANAPAVIAGYLSEVTITGQLANNAGSNVSLGNHVLFEEIVAGSATAIGTFRAINASSNKDGQVSAIYSIGAASAGAKVLLRCTLLRDNGARTDTLDNLALNIITK